MPKDRLIYLIKQNKITRVCALPVVNLIRYWRKITYRFTNEAKRIRRLKNKYEGQRCFIIGNGPSLTVEDLNKLQGEHCFAANHIYKMFPKTQWRPEFFFCVDSYVLREIMEHLSDLDVEHVFIQMEGKKYNLQEKNSNIVYINNYYPYLVNQYKRTKIAFSSDVSKYFIAGETVTYNAIQMATYMGFKEIYLLGVDHQYSKYLDENGDVKHREGISDHFDGEETKEHCVQNVRTTTAAYNVARDYCQKNGIIIKNLTRGGALEVFERAEFDEVIKNNKKQ